MTKSIFNANYKQTTMKQIQERLAIPTGFESFDGLLTTGGIPLTSVCTLRSDPRSSAYQFLLHLARDTPNEAYFVSLGRRKKTIKRSAEQTNANIPSSNIISLSDQPTNQNLIQTISDQPVERNDIVIIDPINLLTDDDAQSYTDLYQTLNQLAVEKNAVVVCHYYTESDEQSVFAPIADYHSDLLLSLSRSYKQSDVSQELWIDRLPAGMGIKESQQDTRFATVEDSRPRLSLKTGGRI